jgi:CRISPR system Cascade subunit CasB
MTDTIDTHQNKRGGVPLVEAMLDLKRKQDRGALAALRTGLGKSPGTAARMFPIVARFLRSDDGPSTTVAFLTAALFASHPEHAEIGSLGASLWKATKRDTNPNGMHGEAGVEARFAAALDADPEDLPRHLEGLVSLCESAGAPIDWNRFYWDVRTLLDDDEQKRTKTRIRWARDFWQGPRKQDQPEAGQEDTE